MIIKSIRLENFRQYKGVNTVNFSVDKDRNITIIIGVNTSGKTTLMQAFNWCLYENTTFRNKELLNSEIATDLTYGAYANVSVEIVLEHEGKEFTIKREQRCSGIGNGKVRSERPSLSVSYKEANGNSIYISNVECENTINKILPVGLSDYFFFDGERIQEINKKKDVVTAVRGLMGLDIISGAVDYLNPDKGSSVVSKLSKELSTGSDEKSEQLNVELDSALAAVENNKSRLQTIDSEIEYARSEKERLAQIMRDTSEVRDLQKKRDDLNRNLSIIEGSIKSAQDRIVMDFNRDYLAYFAHPLIDSALKVLNGTSKQVEGIPEMHAKAIDYILERGKCICGCDLTKNQGAVENIEYEKSLLPPQHIGTVVRSYKDLCSTWESRNANAEFATCIMQDYAEIRRYERRKDEIAQELKNVSQKIKEIGSVNTAQIEDDYAANDRALETKIKQKATIEETLRYLSSRIEAIRKQLSGLAVQNERNSILRREINYAMAVFEWFKDSYDRNEKEVKEDLLRSVNSIFESMYHGSRRVTIDDNYRIQLLTTGGYADISSEESKGLEAVKNFAFVCGLVDLARKKARKGEKSEIAAADMYSTEPYPIVMDAPFSNVDEIHIEKISTILPKIAEQVILIVMKKDWAYAESTMQDKVGARYSIVKVNNADTNSIIKDI